LSYGPIPFHFIRVVWFLPWTGLIPRFTYVCLLHSWGYRDAHSCLAFLLRCGGLTNFLPGLVSSWDSLNLCLSSSCDYSHVPPCSVLCHIFFIH
jgi:hypothetical protein